MTEYLVFPIPAGCVKVKASSVRVAKNKHRKTFPNLSEESLIVVPISHGTKIIGDIILPLWKATFEEIK